MHSAYCLRGYWTHALSRQYARAYAYPGLRAFASLSMARSAGGRDLLLAISKRGDVYLRNLLIHGARAVLRFVERKEDCTSHWATALKGAVTAILPSSRWPTRSCASPMR